MTSCAKFGCREPVTDALKLGPMYVHTCVAHAEDLMFTLSKVVPPEEGREGYLRFCRDRGIEPRQDVAS